MQFFPTNLTGTESIHICILAYKHKNNVKIKTSYQLMAFFMHYLFFKLKNVMYDRNEITCLYHSNKRTNNPLQVY